MSIMTSQTQRQLNILIDKIRSSYFGIRKNGLRVMINKWEFSPSYGEGSSYKGIWVRDNVYLNKELNEEDKLRFTFGWVTTETKFLYTQKADGIMGLSMAK